MEFDVLILNTPNGAKNGYCASLGSGSTYTNKQRIGGATVK
jgi:hypothetical protein